MSVVNSKDLQDLQRLGEQGGMPYLCTPENEKAAAVGCGYFALIMLRDYLGPLGSIVPHPDVAPLFEIPRLRKPDDVAVKTTMYLIGRCGPFLTACPPSCFLNLSPDP